MKIKTYYIAFYKYEDADIWQNTRLNTNKKELEEYMDKLVYIDRRSIHIKEIELPE